MKGDNGQLNGSQGEAIVGAAAGLVQISRRRFLQGLGVTSAVGAAACANPAEQTILPYVKPDPEQIPGVAAWYSSTCTECSAGCGIKGFTFSASAAKLNLVIISSELFLR